MLQYISPREPIHDNIIYTQPRSLRARPTIYTQRLRGGHDILGFLSAAFDLAAAAVPTPHVHVSPAVITGPRPTVPPRHPRAAPVSHLLFSARLCRVCCFAAPPNVMMTESGDVGGRRIRYAVTRRHDV